jgi:hypothetical protein
MIGKVEHNILAIVRENRFCVTLVECPAPVDLPLRHVRFGIEQQYGIDVCMQHRHC